MPSRKYSASQSFRFGFNGKENDNEVKGEGNQQDYGMRVYDPRIGKFLSVDPLTLEYPWYTPYQFAGDMPIIAIDLDGKEPSYMIDVNGKLTKPVIALIMSAFGGMSTDWSENRLTESIWKKDESMRETPRIRATTIPKINGQTIWYNPLFEEKELKNFIDDFKFEPWLNLIVHEEFHIMQQNWGLFSLGLAAIQSLFEDDPKEKLLESSAYSYGHPFDNTTEVAALVKSKEGAKLYGILTDTKKSEADKVKEVTLIGLNYRKSKLLADKSNYENKIKAKKGSLENNPIIELYDRQINEVEEKIKELKPVESNTTSSK